MELAGRGGSRYMFPRGVRLPLHALQLITRTLGCQEATATTACLWCRSRPSRWRPWRVSSPTVEVRARAVGVRGISWRNGGPALPDQSSFPWWLRSASYGVNHCLGTAESALPEARRSSRRSGVQDGAPELLEGVSRGCPGGRRSRTAGQPSRALGGAWRSASERHPNRQMDLSRAPFGAAGCRAVCFLWGWRGSGRGRALAGHLQTR
jgi:hypothetical protein